MSKGKIAFLVTAIIGVIGLFVGASINFEGYLGIILVVATATGFIVSAIDDNKKE